MMRTIGICRWCLSGPMGSGRSCEWKLRSITLHTARLTV
ncbi:hypothetical protein BRADI_3g29793v3 [Brachypodium distachyon]|uniref:Uncharacterized protein n=1 Tax=Brachypodium distachyon TaxID=15368 RepID=A0A2K2D030_BRADI|nr:hypothetical protein BRADI_3g29793v3 [Brachypodium distachyon]